MTTHALSDTTHQPTSNVWRIVVGYAIVAVALIGLILLVLSYGRNLATSVDTAPSAATPAAAAHKLSPLYHVLLALVSILLLGRWMGKLFIYFGQPRVIGEMVAGIAIGPSLLGVIWPAAKDFILPADVGPYLGIIAQIGVILYMFLVGLELNAGLMRSRAHATIAISHTSILVPFFLGTILALWLYPHLRPSTRRFQALLCSWALPCRSPPFPCLPGF